MAKDNFNKQQKTPKAQIELAKKYRKIFLERSNCQ